jgi:uncharacterized membrane protein YedE/YeeE
MPLLSFVSGLVFAVGLCISGMVRPSKVIGFLDLRGAWDPSLAFVMLGALVVYAIAWRLIKRRGVPLLGGKIPGPASKQLDATLFLGAAIFGIGWGLGGYCPGPAIVASAHSSAAWAFVACMLVGIQAGRLARRSSTPASVPVVDG